MTKHLRLIVLVFTVGYGPPPATRVLAQSNNVHQAAKPNAYENVDWLRISTNRLTELVKNSDPSLIPTNAWGAILKRVDWFALPTNVQYYVSDHVDWSLIPSKILEHYNQPEPWPEKSSKQQIREHCAEILRSAVDTNQINEACKKLTNQPNEASALKRMSEDITRTLSTAAGLLNSSALNSTSWNGGYSASVHNPNNPAEVFLYHFNTQKGPIGQFEIRTSEGNKPVVLALFFENGKLKSFSKAKPNQEILSFDENGGVDRHWIQPSAKSQ